MKKGNELTWQILTEDEKSALLLSIHYNKSTWQAGEIMNKAHYKYLEIQARANQFFKMFNEYFKATGNKRIPEGCNINHFFRDYIIYTLFERKNPKEAIKLLGNNPFIVPQAKSRMFKEAMDELANHENTSYRLLYDLIIEFDRWNNSRILTPNLQEPSAFKRRNKSRLIKHLKNLSSLDPYHIDRFISKFQSHSKKPGLYIPVISTQFEQGYEVIKIKQNTHIIEHVSKHLRLYIFEEHVEADTFGYLVSRYLKNQNKDCRDGQKFWPLYRKTIENAYNYLEVNNIIPRRKNLEKAFRDLDEIIIRNNTKKAMKISDPQPRVDEKAFYRI